jgi:transposase
MAPARCPDRVRAALQPTTPASRAPPPPAPARPPSHRHLHGTDHTPIRSRWLDQRIRTSRLKDQVNTRGRVLAPHKIADALRALIHQAHLARDQDLKAIPAAITNELITRFRDGVLVGLSATTTHGTRPGQRKARLLLEVLRDREADVLRFAHDLQVPATSNQAERDLRPSKVQQNVSGRLTSEDRTRDRYTIRGVLSTAAKHGLNMITVLGDALRGRPWMPELPAPT